VTFVLKLTMHNDGWNIKNQYHTFMMKNVLNNIANCDSHFQIKMRFIMKFKQE